MTSLGRTFSIRKRFNLAVSSRVDAQMDWRMDLLEETIATLQRLTTEMSISIADRLSALEAVALLDSRIPNGD
ncbi:hypothetical protein BH10ACT2_BH10ACT2_00050 [soil metagenome]